jgi:hypothetical protein
MMQCLHPATRPVLGVIASLERKWPDNAWCRLLVGIFWLRPSG